MNILEQFLTPELTTIIITALLIPLIKSFSKYVITLINAKVDIIQEKIKREKVNDYIDKIEDIIATVVDSVSQTFVDTLKKEGNFDAIARDEAFNLAKDKVLRLLTSDGLKIIEELYGDVDSWVEDKIETFVRLHKNM